MPTPTPLRSCAPRSLVSLALLAAGAVSPAFAAVGDGDSSPDAIPEIRWEDHVGRARDGSALPGRIGRIRVPENRREPNGRTIELAFVLYESWSSDPGPPIFFLAGGPGGPGIGNVEVLATAPELSLLDHADVIALDQRGTGRSVPNLSEMPDFSWELPLDREIGREEIVAAERVAVKKIAAHWRDKGVDLLAYNTIESADDVDAVRRALGLEQIVPYGSSYGSHLALAYLRRHSEHAARALLLKVEGPDATWKLPSQIQHQVELLHEMIAADPEASKQVPDFLGVVRAAIERLDEEPVEVVLHEGLSNELRVVVGPYEVQRGIGMLLASRRGLAQALLAADDLMRKDDASLARVALRTRRGGDFSAMTLMMDCSSGATAARRERLERERRDPRNLLSDSFDGYYPDICTACGDPDLGDAFRGPLECDVPVLFVSGTIDARTPPTNVEAIAAGFSNHAHVVVENAGHGPDELRSEEFCELMVEFLEGLDVESQTLSLPPIEFRPVQPR